ncbi:MAG: hypothetical protein U0807_06405 [Candidatus Binatia bacterium]
MTTRNRLGQIAIALGAVLLVGATSRPAHAHHWRGRVGIGLGVPAYPYYYPPPVYYPPVAYPYPPAYSYYPAPYAPPGFVAGHWEYRTNRWGRTVEVWIPPHLR